MCGRLWQGDCPLTFIYPGCEPVAHLLATILQSCPNHFVPENFPPSPPLAGSPVEMFHSEPKNNRQAPSGKPKISRKILMLNLLFWAVQTEGLVNPKNKGKDLPDDLMDSPASFYVRVSGTRVAGLDL